MDRPHRARRIVTWACIGLAIVMVAVTGYWVLARSGAAPAPAPIAVPAPSQTVAAAAPPTPAQAGAADGCLGGPDPFAAILPAQQSAPLDPVGAAEFAFAYIRWAQTYPSDPNWEAVLPHITTPGFHDQAAQRLAAGAAATAANPGVDDIAEFRIAASAGAQYRVVGDDPAGQSVSLNVAYTLQVSRTDTGASAQEPKATTVIVDAADGHWVIAANEASGLADPFAPITGAPWVSYAGVC